MKLLFLGTAAAEGFPGLFCNCASCREARALGGKNLRMRSSLLINEDLLIDLVRCASRRAALQPEPVNPDPPA
jgi:phosphoribosyl 1,2-cyclic phosphate phosphodiesterase